ncbi:PQQ-binding-like beta-propeller repeat protein, partial [Chloroflexota bacterium]
MAKLCKPICLMVVIALILTISIPAMAADWPNFRNGASNSGSSSETIDLPLTEQWHSSAPSVEENGAVASNGIVYMSTWDGKLYAFDVSTGSVVSGFPVTTAGNYGAPAVDAVNGKVYVLAANTLFAFNLDGTSPWTAPVGSTGNNYAQGPIIEGGYVYVKAGSNLHKYSSGGVSQWASPTSGISTQPAIMGDYVYVNTESGQIRKYDKATGAEVTTGGFPISTAGSESPVTAVNDKIFHKADQLYVYNASDGSLAWSAPCGGNSTYSRPAVSNGVVYAYGWDGKAYAFDENTGATMAGFPSVALNTPSDRNWSSPAVAGDKVFIGAGTTQKLKVLGAAGSASAGVVLDEYPTFSTDPQGFDVCAPIISDGVVFALLDGGGLYAFFSAGIQWTGGAIVINDGDECTESQTVTLTLDRGASTDVDEMRISEDPFFGGAAWEPYSTTKTWTLSAGYGTKTVYAQFRGPSSGTSNVFNDQIEYSEDCPTVEEEEVEPPEANFKAKPLMGDAPHTVTFRDTSTGEYTEWLWDFGDGESSTSRSPSHTYQQGGTYQVCLTVTGPGGSDTHCLTAQIIVEDVAAAGKLIVRNLNITPAYAQPGQEVQVTAKVVNEGGTWGSDTVNLLI